MWTLRLLNLTTRNVSAYKYLVPSVLHATPYVDVDLSEFQFNAEALDELIAYVNAGDLSVYVSGGGYTLVLLTASDLEKLKYGDLDTVVDTFVLRYTEIDDTDSPYTPANTIDWLGVDTTGGVVNVTLDAASAYVLYSPLHISDVGGNAGTLNITITPDGTDTIDGVNAPITISTNWGSFYLVPVSTTGWVLLSSGAENILDRTHRLGNGEDHSTVASLKTQMLDNHVFSTHAAVILTTLGSQIDAALNGTGTKLFHPLYAVVTVTSIAPGPAPAPNGDAQITIGTAHAGTQILPATALTGLVAAGQQFVIALTGFFAGVAGNATIHVTVSTADTGGAGGAVCTATVKLIGYQD